MGNNSRRHWLRKALNIAYPAVMATATLLLSYVIGQYAVSHTEFTSVWAGITSLALLMGGSFCACWAIFTGFEVMNDWYRYDWEK